MDGLRAPDPKLVGLLLGGVIHFIVDGVADTREIRQPKTKKSIATLPVLRDYVMQHWKPNPTGLLFPAPRKKGYPRSRQNVVKVGMKPVLRKLGIPQNDVGLHAFRHGLATKLADASVPVTVLQNQMRHADVKTTLRIYAYVIPQSQRDAMEAVSDVQLLRTGQSLRKFAVK